jgi:hypothetical protein
MENKEGQPINTSETLNKVHLTEVGKDIKQRIPPEVESWLEKIEKTQPQKTIVDDSTGKPILTPSVLTSDVYSIPITQNNFINGFKKTIIDAGRWLSCFVFRLIKMKKGVIKFKEE